PLPKPPGALIAPAKGSPVISRQRCRCSTVNTARIRSRGGWENRPWFFSGGRGTPPPGPLPPKSPLPPLPPFPPKSPLPPPLPPDPLPLGGGSHFGSHLRPSNELSK